MKADGVSYHRVDVDEAGGRLDNLLVRLLKGVPKSHVYRIIRSGEVRVDGKRSAPGTRLAPGSVVRIPPVRVAAPEASAKFVPPRRFVIVHEDDGLLVVNKPSGIAVHGGSGVDFGVIEQLRASRPELRYLELVHRLDRETSGLLIVAKRRSVLRAVHAQFRARGTRKFYLALSDGPWDKSLAMTDWPLKRLETANGERIVKVRPDGAPSFTKFEVLEEFPDASLLSVELLTGRTHQIRVHMSHAGHPVVNDPKYGNDDRNLRWRGLGLKRLFLHAFRLELENPMTGRPLRLTAEPPRELADFLDVLRSR